VIALSRSAKFVYPDDSAAIHVELRRHHDIRPRHASVRGDHKSFVVMRRFSRIKGPVEKTPFKTYKEAARYWDVQVDMLTQQGLIRRDDKLMGFREEG
jgi:hypothetical protein